MPKDSLSVTDNRTGRSYELPIENGTIRAIDLRRIKVSEDDFGLMGSFVTRWRSRLPEVLASGAGAEIKIPPGNDALIEVLEPFG